MNKTLLLIIVIVVVATLGTIGYLLWQYQQPASSLVEGTPPAGNQNQMITPPAQAPAADSTAGINNDLNKIDLGNLDSDFQAVDSDLNSL